MNTIKLLTSFILCYFVAFIGSMVTVPQITTWYLTLNKPFFTPPNWLFGPVWTILYFFMAVSLYLVWRKDIKSKKTKERAMKFFLLQLSFNFLWSFIFFGLHLPLLGFVTIVILWIFIFLTIQTFKIFSKMAAYLLTPYLIWVSFALFLNLFIALLN